MESNREERIAERVMLSQMSEEKKAVKAEKKTRKKAEKEVKHLKKRKGGRILALAAIVKVNLPNISVKVAAVQTGVDATYPNYIPRDYAIHDVYTNGSTVIIKFDGPENKSFTLSEEKILPDSLSLLSKVYFTHS